MPTIRSPSDGQWGQKENDILEESLCSYWQAGRVKGGIYGNPAWKLLAGTVRRGAEKSLARTTSQCHRMESIVSLERGVC